MKLTREMDVSSIGVSAEEVSPALKSMKAIADTSLGIVNGEDPSHSSGVSNLTNGHNDISLPDSNIEDAPVNGANADSEALGIEVETYSDSRTPANCDQNVKDSSNTKNKCDKLQADHTGSSNSDDNKLKDDSEEDSLASDIYELDNLDSNNLSVQSDEFQLRLSDDEDIILHGSSGGVSKSHHRDSTEENGCIGNNEGDDTTIISNHDSDCPDSGTNGGIISHSSSLSNPDPILPISSTSSSSDKHGCNEEDLFPNTLDVVRAEQDSNPINVFTCSDDSATEKETDSASSVVHNRGVETTTATTTDTPNLKLNESKDQGNNPSEACEENVNSEESEESPRNDSISKGIYLQCPESKCDSNTTNTHDNTNTEVTQIDLKTDMKEIHARDNIKNENENLVSKSKTETNMEVKCEKDVKSELDDEGERKGVETDFKQEVKEEDIKGLKTDLESEVKDKDCKGVKIEVKDEDSKGVKIEIKNEDIKGAKADLESKVKEEDLKGFKMDLEPEVKDKDFKEVADLEPEVKGNSKSVEGVTVDGSLAESTSELVTVEEMCVSTLESVAAGTVVVESALASSSTKKTVESDLSVLPREPNVNGVGDELESVFSSSDNKCVDKEQPADSVVSKHNLQEQEADVNSSIEELQKELDDGKGSDPGEDHLEIGEDSNQSNPSSSPLTINDNGFDDMSDNGMDIGDSVLSSDFECSKENSDTSSRKRAFSNMDEDVQDTAKRKVNGSACMETSNSSEAGTDENSENLNKRPSELDLSEDLGESKKQRVCEEPLVNDGSLDQDNTKDVEEQERLRKLQEAVSSAKGASNGLSSIEETVTGSPPPLPPPLSSPSLSKGVTCTPGQSLNLTCLRKLYKGDLQKMSRSDLEELVMQKMCEAITERSVVGELRLRCQALEKGQEKDREKFNTLRKQMHELNLVLKKYLEQQKEGGPITPVRITRSVGLQVTQAIKPVFPPYRNRGPQFRGNNRASAPPSSPRQDGSSTHQQKSPQATIAPQASRTPPVLSPRRTMPGLVNSHDPPALVPTSAPTSTVLVAVPTSTTPIVSRQVAQPPRMQVPPLQYSNIRPRLSVPPTITNRLPPAQMVQMHQRQPSLQIRQNSPQRGVRQAAPVNDVEVIDIIDNDQSKQSNVQLSPQQMQHQQKQAANAAAQNLAQNTGMTVRLINPPPSGVALAAVSQQLLLPTHVGQQKMIIATAPQSNSIRGNVKFLMKGQAGNVLIPIQGQVSTGVVRMPTQTAQQAVQQIFSTAGGGVRASTVATVRPQPQAQLQTVRQLAHPAPLPPGPAVQPNDPSWKQVPPRPNLKIQHQNNGIVLSWNMSVGPVYADIDSYQLYAYQEGSAAPTSSLWKKVGDVKALPLPMACTLTQFVEGHRYHFTVRAVDKHGRVGPFSQQGSIRLGN